MEIATNLETIKKTIPQHITLVAVSKTKPNSAIIEAYNAGQRIFGENKVQELSQKYEQLPKDIEWHFIGHLQSNKIKYISSFVSLIHGVDTAKLLLAINKEGKKINRKIRCLLQFHIAEEETKFGLSMDEIKQFFRETKISDLEFIEICGIMGMATFTNSKDQISKEFKNLNSIYKELKKDYFSSQNSFKEISMGMSGDYLIAIEQGSTMVRIGSSIFGERNYNK